GADACLVGGTAGFNTRRVRHKHLFGARKVDATLVLGDAEFAGASGPQGFEPTHTEEPAAHPAFGLELFVDRPDGIGADGIADALRNAGGGTGVGLEGGVHADHFAVEVKQRTAAVAAVDRRVGLDGAEDRRGLLDAAVLLAHDATGHAERRAFATFQVQRI